MAIRRIVLLGEEILRVRGEEVTTFDSELNSLVQDMLETMYHAEGIGLAAPQIGVSLRVCVLDLGVKEGSEAGHWVLVNPMVAKTSKKTVKAPEGCLSIPEIEEVVTRFSKVTVSATDASGRPLEIEAEGLLARALQHEIDHLDGVLFIDQVSPLKRRLALRKWKKSQEESLDE
ncbi:MAG: peptide deformylase [Gemmatimonadota bacterium]|nr:peptide deformylase [Gemmatimonadota bacterium]